MKLRKETINTILCEVTRIKSMLFNNSHISIEEMFALLVKYFNLRTDALEDALEDSEFTYFDIHTKHTITTIFLKNNCWKLGSIEVWEDENSCGIWNYNQIENNEVEFNS